MKIIYSPDISSRQLITMARSSPTIYFFFLSCFFSL